jgi:hypothetical protein
LTAAQGTEEVVKTDMGVNRDHVQRRFSDLYKQERLRVKMAATAWGKKREGSPRNAVVGMGNVRAKKTEN